MKNSNAIRFIIVLIISVILFSGCTSAPPEIRAGEWKGSTDFGDFTLYVDPGGTEITKIDYSFQSCSSAILSGSVKFSGSLERKDGGPISTIDNGKFEIDAQGVTTIYFKGKFNSAGTSASGKWEAGACSANWTMKR